MLHSGFFQKLYQLQLGIMGDKVTTTNYGTLVYNQSDPSEFWNHLFVDQIIKPSDLSQIERLFTDSNRLPAIYFEKSVELAENIISLSALGFKEICQDSWMFFQGQLDKSLDLSSVKKVLTKSDLEIYLSTFDKCYQKDDPQNPYGTLGEYLDVARKVWHTQNPSNHLEYFIVYHSDKPVAVSALSNYQGLGYISNVGSLKEVRGQGFGKLATLKCIEASIENGNTDTCLATEENNYPNEFYKRLGFTSKFIGLLFSKK